MLQITDGGILCDACFTLIPRTTSEDQTTPIPDFGHHKFALVDRQLCTYPYNKQFKSPNRFFYQVRTYLSIPS